MYEYIIVLNYAIFLQSSCFAHEVENNYESNFDTILRRCNYITS